MVLLISKKGITTSCLAYPSKSSFVATSPTQELLWFFGHLALKKHFVAWHTTELAVYPMLAPYFLSFWQHLLYFFWYLVWIK